MAKGVFPTGEGWWWRDGMIFDVYWSGRADVQVLRARSGSKGESFRVADDGFWTREALPDDVARSVAATSPRVSEARIRLIGKLARQIGADLSELAAEYPDAELLPTGGLRPDEAESFSEAMSEG